jgi:hypothetical protein
LDATTIVSSQLLEGYIVRSLRRFTTDSRDHGEWGMRDRRAEADGMVGVRIGIDTSVCIIECVGVSVMVTFYIGGLSSRTISTSLVGSSSR